MTGHRRVTRPGLCEMAAALHPGQLRSGKGCALELVTNRHKPVRISRLVRMTLAGSLNAQGPESGRLGDCRTTDLRRFATMVVTDDQEFPRARGEIAAPNVPARSRVPTSRQDLLRDRGRPRGHTTSCRSGLMRHCHRCCFGVMRHRCFGTAR